MLKLRNMIGAGVVFLSILAPSMRAEGYNITLYPNFAGNTNVSANPFSSAAGFSGSSWQAPGTAAKSESYIPVSLLFSQAFTVGDIQSISYWTNKPGNSGSPDWTLLLYTVPLSSGNEASWYHSRLNSEPYLTGTPAASDPANTWHEWSTSDPSNPMRFYDQGRSGNFGTYTDPTLASLAAGAITWGNNTTVDYSGEYVNLISLQTGSAWAAGFDGEVDGLTVTLKNGDVATANLEAVPEPSTIFLLGGSLAVLASFRRRFGLVKR